MYSIPAPVIKKLLDYCDLSSAIAMARVTKRCSTIFKQYREEILKRNEYVNVVNMFKYCSDEYIISMKNHKYFTDIPINECNKRYELYAAITLRTIYICDFSIEEQREFYKSGKYDYFPILSQYEESAAKLGVKVNNEFSKSYHGLLAAIYLQDEVMINELQPYGNFYVYCITGNYHLADNYDVDCVIKCINDSNNPVATFEYIKKRGYEFDEKYYVEIENVHVLKMVINEITNADNISLIDIRDYDSLVLLTNKFLEFTTIEKIFQNIYTCNIKFTKYLLQKYKHLAKLVSPFDLRVEEIVELIDYIDNKKIMEFSYVYYNFYLMRILIKRNGREWAQQYDHPFIKEYYSSPDTSGGPR